MKNTPRHEWISSKVIAKTGSLSARTNLDAIYHPDDTELIMTEIAAGGNSNEDGGELGDDDWPVV